MFARVSGGDDPNTPFSFSMHNDEDIRFSPTYGDETVLTVIYPIILNLERRDILEDPFRLVERNSVLRKVRSCLRIVPFEVAITHGILRDFRIHNQPRPRELF